MRSSVRVVPLLRRGVATPDAAAYLPRYGLDQPWAADTTAAATDDLIPVRRESYGGGRIIDISHRYHSHMPSWESEDGVGRFLWLAKSMKNGSNANNSEMKLSAHTGTHVDAPGHVFDRYFDAGFDVDTLDLEVLNGPALLVDVPRNKNITADVMKYLDIPKGVRRVLFRTLNTERLFNGMKLWRLETRRTRQNSIKCKRRCNLQPKRNDT